MDFIPSLIFFSDFPFEEGKITLEPGCVMAIYSDGITESMNEREEEFGEKRFAEVVTACANESSESIIQHILNAVEKHVGNMLQMDDMTLLIIKRV